MTDAVRCRLERVARAFGEAAPLPREVFVEPWSLALETRALFASAWIPVAHEADLPRPGDWVKTPIAGEELVVVRTHDLSIAALHAVCTHRGTLLCEGERGRFEGLTIVCPYHGFTFATDGRAAATPGAAPGGDSLDLSTARVETFAGVIFVNLDASAPPLLESWDGGPPWLSRAKGWSLVRARRVDNEVRANWKVVVGNFQESHHFPHVHPSLEKKTPWSSSSSVVSSEAWLGGVMDLAPGFETVSESGSRKGRAFVAAKEDRHQVHDAFVFPLLMTSLQPDYLLTYRLAPLAVDRTLVVSEIHVHPSALAEGSDLADVFAFWDRTNAEDRRICELQHRGLSSRHATRTRYVESEDGLHAFEAIVARRYSAALAKEGA